MSDTVTARLALPMLQPAQAQKHVTVNEALMRLDGLVNLTFEATSRMAPPDTVREGACFLVPDGAVNAWAGKGGQIAIAANGGWVFAIAAQGMRAFSAEDGLPMIHDGVRWVAGALTLGPAGSGMLARVEERLVTLTPGGSVTSDLVVPASAMVIGATARVVTPIIGTASGWKLGTAGAEDRFGAGLGLATGSWARGMLSTPMTYWSPEPLVLSAVGGTFAGGQVRLALHWWELRLPA